MVDYNVKISLLDDSNKLRFEDIGVGEMFIDANVSVGVPKVRIKITPSQYMIIGNEWHFGKEDFKAVIKPAIVESATIDIASLRTQR